ncbi:hypothetical protein PRIPAC_73882 [Pristionchus pacificus]|uniref:Uncharacterized protein n=1 Tax=Pristionchus pacificus TaxID=54126 RepID=A0A2A6BEI5_PRIPA|nr:hypothetical protein PRIPAC_73882 [Pristionchus pacificus]|eukprot:PDM64315.1 hypothetical protein PRIPAC_52571 [Pristionchus pacificus]
MRRPIDSVRPPHYGYGSQVLSSPLLRSLLSTGHSGVLTFSGPSSFRVLSRRGREGRQRRKEEEIVPNSVAPSLHSGRKARRKESLHFMCSLGSQADPHLPRLPHSSFPTLSRRAEKGGEDSSPHWSADRSFDLVEATYRRPVLPPDNQFLGARSVAAARTSSKLTDEKEGRIRAVSRPSALEGCWKDGGKWTE